MKIIPQIRTTNPPNNDKPMTIAKLVLWGILVVSCGCSDVGDVGRVEVYSVSSEKRKSIKLF